MGHKAQTFNFTESSMSSNTKTKLNKNVTGYEREKKRDK
jgi:hypothetical protein